MELFAQHQSADRRYEASPRPGCFSGEDHKRKKSDRGLTQV